MGLLEKPKLKKDCPLDKALTLLEKHKGELAGIEGRYREFEGMVQRAHSLEVGIRDLRRQLKEKTCVRDDLLKEYQQSRNRLEAHRLAVEAVGRMEKALADARALQQRRCEAEKEVRTAEKQAEMARREAEEKTRILREAERCLRELQDHVQALTSAIRDVQARRNAVTERLQLLTLQDQVKVAREKLELAEKADHALEELKRQTRERAAPDPAALRRFEEHRTTAGKLRAELDAAAITLTLTPDPGAPVPRLALDSGPAVDVPPDHGVSIRRSIRRRAEIGLPGWGRAELARGSDTRSLDQIENELNELDYQFADGLAPFGLTASDPAALDQLRGLAGDKKVRDAHIKTKQEEVDHLASRGLDLLREEVAGLEKRLQASESAVVSTLGGNELPAETAGLEELGKRLKAEIDGNQNRADACKQQADVVEGRIEGTPDVNRAAVKKGRKTDGDHVLGLRQQEGWAKATLAALNATVALRRDELDRMPTAVQIDGLTRTAQAHLAGAQRDLEATRLTESEETIRERLAAAEESLRVLSGQEGDAQKDLHQIQGAMTQSEGLHQKRAAAARVEELTAQTEREQLESEAFDRLYALFEECRQKRLGAVRGPNHDRVLRWMRLLRIGGYQSIGFNDQFLPEKLVSGDGATEMMLDAESTGTLEQIALMVRLALGATLSTRDEPVAAMLDDPLTHSDVVRLDLMRAILKSASVGDTSSTSPAGPLQILVFTCHPEWFAIDGARIVDLSKPEVLNRSCF